MDVPAPSGDRHLPSGGLTTAAAGRLGLHATHGHSQVLAWLTFKADCLAVGNLLDREQIMRMCTSVVYVCLSAVSVAY